MVPFYDNSPDEGHSGTIEIDRVYCFAFHRFEDNDWSALDQVYRSLPGYIGYDPVPRWFSSSELAAPYLLASVEPPGLQVVGVLPVADWREWDERFRAGTAGLPSYEPE